MEQNWRRRPARLPIIDPGAGPLHMTMVGGYADAEQLLLGAPMQIPAAGSDCYISIYHEDLASLFKANAK